jgi:hypothetical protein
MAAPAGSNVGKITSQRRVTTFGDLVKFCDVTNASDSELIWQLRQCGRAPPSTVTEMTVRRPPKQSGPDLLASSNARQREYGS